MTFRTLKAPYFFTFILLSMLLYDIGVNSSVNITTRKNTQSNLPARNLSKNSSNIKFDYRANSKEATRPHYALNPFLTHNLALREESLAKNLTKIISDTSSLFKNDPCYLNINKYLHGFHKDIDPKYKQHRRAKIVTDNPILSLRMIRRILVDLENHTRSSCQNSLPEVVNAIESIFGEKFPPVTAQDLDDALLGLLRIQFIYGFNATNEIRLGIFNGVKTGASLDPEDCLALANKAIEIEADALAYQWLVSASLSCPQKQMEYEYTQNGSCIAIESNPNGETESWLKLLGLTNAGSIKELHEILRNKRQEKIKGKSFEYSKYATCRGETFQQQQELICYYTRDSDPYFNINPLKTEMISKEPLILQFYELVGDQTIELISNLTFKYMRRSGVINRAKPQAEFDTFRRTSVNGWLPDTENVRPDKRLVRLNERVEKLTGLEVLKKWASYFQVVWYGSLGGHYDFHDDSMQGTGHPMDHKGDRIATLLFFLSNVKMGGYTAFPRVGVFAKPVKGSAILWYNLWRNGTKDKRLEHGGCPVIFGTKQVANRWILQNENIWKYPCLLDQLA